jgi:hypothetical protein
MLLPYSAWEEACREIEQLVKKQKIAIALGSLKLFNGKNHNLSFTGEGICLSIDVRNNDKSVSFFNALDTLCEKYKALVNISKDSRINHDLITRVYPGYELFKNKLKSFDAGHKIQSELKTRLKLGL